MHWARGILGEQRVVRVDRRRPVQPEPLLAVEVDEEEADARVLGDVAEREVHPVAVPAREGDRALVEHADEAGIAALVGALRRAVGVGRREEEHVARLDERAVAVVDRVVHDPLLDPVGEPPRVEAVLEPAVALVVERHGVHHAPRGCRRPRRRDRRLDHGRLSLGRRSRDRLAGGGRECRPAAALHRPCRLRQAHGRDRRLAGRGGRRCGCARRAGRDQRHRPGPGGGRRRERTWPR